ncbi:Esterase FE4 [Eumeta japonica]|uniref:Esterase FE4 n=1 Tax=Eumeta variegata TaxID=151549 RepID=A0A4C1V7A5_EUMVA|nr:Esterase FE4 [Eumeta japonica]
MEGTRNSWKCPLFGDLCDLKDNILSSYEDVMKFYEWTRHKLKHEREIKKEPTYKEIEAIVVPKLIEICVRSSIPTVEPKRVKIDAAARLLEERVLERATSQNILLSQINILALPTHGSHKCTLSCQCVVPLSIPTSVVIYEHSGSGPSLDCSPTLNPDLDTAPHSDSNHDLDSNFGPTLDFDFGLVLISIPVSTFDSVSVSVLVCSCACFVLLVCGQQRIVTIAQGQVRGHLARDIYTFHGIPYATAPTGNQKFKGPLPAPSWDGVFDAIDNIIICPQNSFIIGPLPYTENCLIVNVYVPDTNSTSKPVLVVVHGGAFAYGFGNSGIPYSLVDRDIIVVTFNYRVGVHGFLCLNTENVPGNAGLKDQITALRWIKNNIEAFGGNPHDITLSGYSAGAGAAELLMLSPAATDLFHKVILESGSALNTWAVNPDGLEYARKVAAQNGATNINNVEQLEEYYTRLSYPELVTLVGNDQLFSFLPCLENTSENDAVITTMPEDVLRSGNYTKLPLLTGYTDAEGLLYYNERETRMTEMNENFSSQLPPNFDFYSVLKEYEAIDLIKSFYFDEEVITENSIRNYTDYFTDSIFSYGIVESSRLHALNGAPTYLYEFSYVVSTDELRDTGLGANHCAQTYLIFTNVETGPNGTHTETDAVVQRRLLDMWSNFIKVREPMSPEQSNYWESLDAERMNYLVINTELEKRSFPIPERMRLWEEVMQEGDDSDAACAIHFHIGLLFLSCIILIR